MAAGTWVLATSQIKITQAECVSVRCGYTIRQVCELCGLAKRKVLAFVGLHSAR